MTPTKETRENYIKNNREIINLRYRLYNEKRCKEPCISRIKKIKRKIINYYKLKKAKKLKNPLVQLKTRVLLRTRLNIAVKNNFKKGLIIRDLGCSIPEFKIYFEKKFKKGMNWDNRGKKTWHIDHIKPLAKFDLTKESELKKACHYTNLQPLSAYENHRKNSKY